MRVSHVLAIEQAVFGTYKYPTKVLSVVDMEEVLKAGHCVEPARDIQFCAIAVGAAARIDSRAVLVLTPIADFFRVARLLCPSLIILSEICETSFNSE